MRNLTFLLFFLSISFLTLAQNSKSDYNFGFEKKGKVLPEGFGKGGDKEFEIFSDSNTVRSGKYSLAIQNDSYATFGSATASIPHSLEGKFITISGYIKTEGVKGYCGLWIRLDPQKGFDNMQSQEIKGDMDWTKFETELMLYPDVTERIVYGALLVGEGKVWFDDLEILIDGKPVWNADIYQKELLPADLDTAFGQASGIKSEDLKGSSTADLEVLCKVWGFLKYYHPSVMAGQYQMDYELFRFLPEYLEVNSQQERDALLVNWIDSFGEYTSLKKMNYPDAAKVKLYPDLDWINTSGFSEQLESTLSRVKLAKREKSGYYFSSNSVGGADMGNELPYSEMKASDAGMRLLTLYRYWNIIQYLSPYKYTIEEDWHEVLHEFLPQFVEVDEQLGYENLVARLIVRTKDSHAAFMKYDGELYHSLGLKTPAFRLKYVEGKPVVAKLYEIDGEVMDAEMEIGDEILEVNHLSVGTRLDELLPITSGSNYPTKLRNAAGRLWSTNEDSIHVLLRRNGQLKEVVLSTYSPNELGNPTLFVNEKTSFKMLDNNIAYLNNGALMVDDLPAYWEKFKNADGLIIDNRNYPKNFPLFDLGALLLSEDVPFARFSYVSVTQPGLFRMQTEKNAVTVGSKNTEPFKGRVIILVNEITQSSSEYCAMAYRAVPGALVVGSTTAGADGNVTNVVLPGAIKSWITGIGVYYPDGGETQRVGIVPDVEVKPTIKGLKEGRDEVLEKALELLKNSK